MIAAHERNRHQEVWLLLPWLANGRLSAPEREMVEEHVRECPECQHELTLQHRICGAFCEPDRVTYAPGPSFRKLMDRIDREEETADHSREAPRRERRLSSRPLARSLRRVSLWRPPGLAWAASFLVMVGATGMMLVAYHWSEPAYRTHTDTPATSPDVLHIALDRSVPIGEVEEVLRNSGARIVEGPDNAGVLGVTPVGVAAGRSSPAADAQLRALSKRLRKDPRVLWVQPLADVQAPAEQRVPDAQEH
jgi:hypothetical protein